MVASCPARLSSAADRVAAGARYHRNTSLAYAHRHDLSDDRLDGPVRRRRDARSRRGLRRPRLPPRAGVHRPRGPCVTIRARRRWSRCGRPAWTSTSSPTSGANRPTARSATRLRPPRAAASTGFSRSAAGPPSTPPRPPNLYATWPADFLDYVNPTLGRGTTPPGPLKPLIAVPTTAGPAARRPPSRCSTSNASGSRRASRTATCVRRSASSIPMNTRSCPKAVAASAGLDVLSHALESFTARPLPAARAAGSAVAASRLPGRQPDQRRLGARGAPHHGRVPPRVYADASR